MLFSTALPVLPDFHLLNQNWANKVNRTKSRLREFTRKLPHLSALLRLGDRALVDGVRLPKRRPRLLVLGRRPLGLARVPPLLHGLGVELERCLCAVEVSVQ